MRRISAKAARKGDLVTIVAPSTLIESDLLLKGVKKLSALGYVVNFDERILSRYRSFAGLDEIRAKVLEKALRNTAVRIIWSARGGYGLTRLLSLLDDFKVAKLMQRNPKIFIGYSDATALHIYLYKKIGLRTLHAPMLATPSFQKISARNWKLLLEILRGEIKLGKKSYTTAWPTRWLLPVQKEVEGVVLGGNLTLITNLLGTPWQPDFRSCILFIEDCGEPPYKIDRMLTQLWNSGVLRGVKAVITGDLNHEVKLAPGQSKNDWKIVLQDRLAANGIPVLIQAPVGHGKRNDPLPLGVRVRLTVKGKIELLEQLVRK
jgi:muramoyltetrapeptide carboxypeptidase